MITVELSDFDVVLCMEFARDVVASYRAGKKEMSKALVIHDRDPIWENETEQYNGRAGEFAVCKMLGLNPMTSLNWGDLCDDGADFQYRGTWVDVKATGHPRGSKLIWPVSKVPLYATKKFDALCLARVRQHEVDVFGFISKVEFVAMKHVSDGSDNLTPGTWYVHGRNLHPAMAFENWGVA